VNVIIFFAPHIGGNWQFPPLTREAMSPERANNTLSWLSLSLAIAFQSAPARQLILAETPRYLYWKIPDMHNLGTRKN
jgi:hypothetical protein